MSIGEKVGQETAVVREFHVEKPLPGTNAVKLQAVDRKLSRLEYMVRKELITPRQYTAGAWLAERWEAYFTPGVSSGIEDHAPGSIPADPFARWTKGQTGFTTRRGKVYRVAPPPTFRPKKPAESRYGHDGWSHRKLDALQRWIRANRLMQLMPAMEREAVTLIAVEGMSPEAAISYMLKLTKRPAGRQIRQVTEALCRGLDIIADEIEPRVRDMVA